MEPNATSLARALPSLDRTECRLRRCVSMSNLPRAGAVPMPWMGCFEFITERPKIPDAIAATLETGDGVLRLLADRETWPALASAFQVKDPARRNSLVTVILRQGLGQTPQWLRGVEIEAITSIREMPATGLAFRISTVPLPVLGVDDAFLHSFEASVHLLGTPRGIQACSIKLPCRISVLARCIGPHRLRNLEIGDVLLLPTLGPERAIAGNVRWGCATGKNLQASVELQQNRMTLKTTPALADSPACPLQGADADEEWDNLELPITLEIQGPALTIGEIAALQPGSGLELRQAVERAEVSIRVAGQAVGAGELVAIGDRLGVRVVRMHRFLGTERGVATDAATGMPQESHS